MHQLGLEELNVFFRLKKCTPNSTVNQIQMDGVQLEHTKANNPGMTDTKPAQTQLTSCPAPQISQ